MEFCLAHYFSEFARPADQLRLWDWIYIRTQPASDDYYPFWLYLCEMPKHRRDPETWLGSIELLFWPTIPTEPAASKPRYYAKRSNEMIYRAWQCLNDYCNSPQHPVRQQANRILDVWRSEFEQLFLKGKFGEGPNSAEEAAKQLTNDFLTIEQKPFTMGTIAENVIPASVRRWAEEKFNRYRIPKTGSAQLTQDYFNHWTSKGGQRERDRIEPLVRKALQENDLNSFMLHLYRFGNNHRAQCNQQGKFRTMRRSITNAWYRLYDSTWGDNSQQSVYQRYSATPEHPAVDLNFFDSWVLCQWLRWENHSCRLLWEDEWEYCAKLGLTEGNWWWNFWFGQQFDTNRHRKLLNCFETGEDATLPASSDRASPRSKEIDPQGRGLMDFQGNHWVWCQDVYRDGAQSGDGQVRWQGRFSEDSATDASFGRVVRGGSFQDASYFLWCSTRGYYDPSISARLIGCRVARADF